ncbi:proteasome assembly chaperone 2 isoform X3 [Ahaetulla prasina]|uniref:proteasome assembly chaperone 2 isoform X3 n=1 Tax=Ahaetulla prasina TaxID=499056 RepID=UPI00264724B8|nr:proteasome assembly chaperone 2 isoform X3 [Ahaetulla prasina]
MFVSCDGCACSDFKGFTLLMPAVSVGNVGQLAIDLVISTLHMPRVGYFYTDCLVPMVGNNPYATTEEDATELCINAEVYAATSKELVVLQIRSPFIKNKYRTFCQILLSWVKKSGFSKIVLLSSSHAYQRNDQQLHGCSKGIPLVVLLKFCSEGDNIPDAFVLADYLNETLPLIAPQSSTSQAKSSRWKIPSSWKLLFGSGLPSSLF